MSVGYVVAVSNLRLQEKSRNPATAGAGDFTVFQQHPNSPHLVEAVKKLKSNLPVSRHNFFPSNAPLNHKKYR